MKTRFQGVYPALVTPLTKDEKLNLPALEKLLRYEMGEGADGFYIGGATGECRQHSLCYRVHNNLLQYTYLNR